MVIFKEDVIKVLRTVSSVVAAIGFCVTLFLSRSNYDLQKEVEYQDSLRLRKENLPFLKVFLDSAKYTYLIERKTGKPLKCYGISCVVEKNPLFNVNISSNSAECFYFNFEKEKAANVAPGDTITLYYCLFPRKTFTDSASLHRNISLIYSFEDRLRNKYRFIANTNDDIESFYTSDYLLLARDKK